MAPRPISRHRKKVEKGKHRISAIIILLVSIPRIMLRKYPNIYSLFMYSSDAGFKTSAHNSILRSKRMRNRVWPSSSRLATHLRTTTKYNAAAPYGTYHMNSSLRDVKQWRGPVQCLPPPVLGKDRLGGTRKITCRNYLPSFPLTITNI